MSETNIATPAPEPEPSSSLDDEARRLNLAIDKGEMKASCLMWELGDVMERQKAENPDWNWDKWLSHAETLGICKTRFSRSLRIRRRFDTVKDVEGRSLLDALGYKRHPDEPEPKQPGTVEALPVKARITRKEQMAAEVFVKRVGDPLRALSVLVRFRTGETPKEQEKQTKARAKQMLKEGVSLDAVREVMGKSDIENQEQVVEVLTALKDGASEMLGTDNEKTAAYVGEVLEGMKKDEDQSQQEPGKDKSESKSQDEPKPQVEPGEKKPEHWAYGKVAGKVAHKTGDDKGAVKAVIVKHTTQKEPA